MANAYEIKAERPVLLCYICTYAAYWINQELLVHEYYFKIGNAKRQIKL